MTCTCAWWHRRAGPRQHCSRLQAPKLSWLHLHTVPASLASNQCSPVVCKRDFFRIHLAAEGLLVAAVCDTSRGGAAARTAEAFVCTVAMRREKQGLRQGPSAHSNHHRTYPCTRPNQLLRVFCSPAGAIVSFATGAKCSDTLISTVGSVVWGGRQAKAWAGMPRLPALSLSTALGRCYPAIQPPALFFPLLPCSGAAPTTATRWPAAAPATS